MSLTRGSSNRTRPQKHQNRTAFKNDLHDTSHKTKFINSLEVHGVCQRCKAILEWKIKYKKYKPLTAPRKCTSCLEKTVRHAYHVLCSKCSSEKVVCAKCCTAIAIEKQDDTKLEIEDKLSGLSERKRRTVLRYLKKLEDGDEKVTSKSKTIDEILMQLDEINLGKDDDDDLKFSSDECDLGSQSEK